MQMDDNVSAGSVIMHHLSSVGEERQSIMASLKKCGDWGKDAKFSAEAYPRTYMYNSESVNVYQLWLAKSEVLMVDNILGGQSRDCWNIEGEGQRWRLLHRGKPLITLFSLFSH